MKRSIDQKLRLRNFDARHGKIEYCIEEAKRNKEQCVTIHGQLRDTLANSLVVIGHSRGLDQQINGTEPILTIHLDHVDRMAEEMKENLFRSGHQIFRASIAFETGQLRRKGGRKKSIHFNVLMKTSSCFSAQ